MKRKAIAKIKSNNGASLTVALLLFLVCAVVGAVVLTAGTASSGRLSDLAEMDQRYYSVTSAARLLAENVCDKPVTIVRTKEVAVITTSHFTVTTGDDGDTVTPGTVEKETHLKYCTDLNGMAAGPHDVEAGAAGNEMPQEGIGVAAIVPDMSFLTERATVLLFGTNHCNTDAAWAFSVSEGGFGETGTFVLNHESAGKDVTALNVDGTFEMKNDGTLVVTLSNANGNAANKYTLRITFDAVVEESAERAKDNLPVDAVKETGGYKEIAETLTKETKTLRVTWVLGGMEVEQS